VPWPADARAVEIEPSLYAADFARLGEQIEALLAAGMRVLHFDVGDGHFVPPVTIGPIVLASLAPLLAAGGAVTDVHLMTEHPERHFEAVRDAGGAGVTFHLEAVADPAETREAAHALGLAAGLAFKPQTSPEQAAAAAEGFDLVLCMAIEPGYSGQPFLPEALPRIARLRELLPDHVRIQVDGGIGAQNARAVVEAGASLLVAGSSVFGRPDLGEAFRSLEAAATG
jgi:ribulose-phosphate 3-epimerase